MRLLLLSLGIWVLARSIAPAQSAAGHPATPGPQIPLGQTYKDFQFPLYQNGQLNATLSAASATGITINRAETNDLKIDLYSNGKVTTTITSPKADLYVADRIMRTKHTVQIERVDMEATAQTCDFDLIPRKYLLRERVKVILKNFEVMPSNSSTKAPVTASTLAAPVPQTAPAETHSPTGSDSLLEMPGAYANTNIAPIPPPNPSAP